MDLATASRGANPTWRANSALTAGTAMVTVVNAEVSRSFEE
ncbi:hypothetical protein ACQRWP_05790 [Micromonospora trifolii]